MVLLSHTKAEHESHFSARPSGRSEAHVDWSKV